MASPLTPQDRLEIMDVIAEYAITLDSRDVEGYANVFAPDGVLNHIGGQAVGHDAIRDRGAFLLESGRAHPGLRHFVGLPQIHGDADRAHAITYCIILEHDGEQHIGVPLVGRYEDICVKVDARWRIQERKTHAVLNQRAPRS